MSYDLGYEIGYEGQDNQPSSRVRPKAENVSAEPVLTPYRMNGVGGPKDVNDFLAKYISPSGTQAPLPQPAPSGSAITATRSGPTGADAAKGLEGMGGKPPNPGDKPAAPVDTPAVSHEALMDAHRGAEWDGVRKELSGYYGFNPSEIDAFEAQYRGMTPDQLTSGNPPILPPLHATGYTPFDKLSPKGATSAERMKRNDAAEPIRRRVADDMVHDTGDKIYDMFVPNKISRETSYAMAAQMYRRASVDPDANPDANPPNIVAMYQARRPPKEGGPSSIGRQLNELRGSNFQPPDPQNPLSGLDVSDFRVKGLLEQARGYYQLHAADRLTPLFGNKIPGAGKYYDKESNRVADANLFLIQKTDSSHPDPGREVGIIREIAITPRPTAKGMPDALQPQVNSFAQSLGQPAPSKPPGILRGELERKMAIANPTQTPDTSNLSPKERQEVAMKRIEANEAEQREIRKEDRDKRTQIEKEDRDKKTEIEREDRQLRNQLIGAKAQNDLQLQSQMAMAVFNNALQMGSELMKSALQKSEMGLQMCMQDSRKSAELGQAIVQGMFGGGMGARGARAHA